MYTQTESEKMILVIANRGVPLSKCHVMWTILLKMSMQLWILFYCATQIRWLTHIARRKPKPKPIHSLVIKLYSSMQHIYEMNYEYKCIAYCNSLAADKKEKSELTSTNIEQSSHTRTFDLLLEFRMIMKPFLFLFYLLFMSNRLFWMWC